MKTQKLGDWAAAENLLKLKEKTKGDFQRGEGSGSTYISGSGKHTHMGILESTSWQLLYLHSCGGIVAKSGSGFCQIFF